MKTNNGDLVFSWVSTLIFAIIIGLLAVLTVRAESNFNFDVLNGLFTPTQSERFFQAGREDFEQAVKSFTYPEQYLRDDLLQIDPEIIEQLNQPKSDHDFDLDAADYQLYPESID